MFVNCAVEFKIMRLFVAVPVPEDIRKKVALLGNEINQDGVNIVKSENMHLTIKFIGEIDDSRADGIKKALQTVKHKKFECRVCGVGVFPNKSYIRVVWAGVESNNELEKFAVLVKEKLTAHGKDEDRFSAHLTIARVKKKMNIDEFLNKHEKHEFGHFMATKFELVQSFLGLSGPRYVTLASFNLD
jgi:2'-5' RNA ligase